MSLQVVIPYLVHPWALVDCIESMGRTDVPVLVVDNSKDSEAASLPLPWKWQGGNVSYTAMSRNIGIAAAWNLGIDRGADQTLICSQWVRFAPAEFPRRELAPWGMDHIARGIEEHGTEYGCTLAEQGFHLISVGRALVDRIGVFDENFCVDLDTPVLTRDLTWVRAGELAKGDALIGVDEHPPSQAGRRYVPSTITKLRHRRAKCLRFVLDDEREVVVTQDHRWLVKSKYGGAPWRWEHSDRLKVGDRLLAPLRPWRTETSFDAGWLSGLFDGEGSLSSNDRTRQLSLCQNPGPVFDRAKAVLQSLGIPFTWYDTPGSTSKIYISVRPHVLETLGRLRPTRLMLNRAWEGMHIRSKAQSGYQSIVAIEDVGYRDVMSCETSSRTYIANGIVSHNCYGEDDDYRWRMDLAGLGGSMGSWPHPGVFSIGYGIAKRTPGAMGQDPIDIGEYWRHKWGTSGSNELGGYPRPFGNPKNPLAYWPKIRR